MRDKSRAKVNITLRIAAVMLVLVLISASMISGMYARYTTTAYGEDSARVAKFDVSVTAADNNPTEFSFANENDVKTGTWSLTVTSSSEVAVEYDIVLTLSEAMPEDGLVSFTVDGKTPTVNGAVYTFKNIGAFPAGGGTASHTLTIEGRDFWFKIDTDVKVDVVARQID